MKCNCCGHELVCPNCTGGALIPVAAPPARRAVRLPPGWMPDADVIAAMKAQFPFIHPDWFREQHEVFTDYWIAQPGERGRKTDWNATWRNWIRRAASGMTQNGHPGVSRVDQKANDWLTR